MNVEFDICFVPGQQRVAVEPGTTVTEAATCADVLIEQPCGGRGRCGKCRVRFVEGAPPPSLFDRRTFSAPELSAGWRLACQTVVLQSATIEIPTPTLAVSVKTFGKSDLFPPDFERAVVAQTVVLDCESRDDQVSLLERVARAAGRPGIPKATVKTVGELAQMAASRPERIGVIWEEDVLRAVIPAEAVERTWGVAIDLGTTTVAGALIDLRDGSVVAAHSALNGQTRFGADVISRITYAMERPDGTATLQQAAATTINDLIATLCRKAQIQRHEIVALSLAGNSTMEHLVAGISPASLGIAPYIGAWRGERSIPAAHLKLGLHAKARIWMTPMVRSNVGGDTVAAMLATGMDRDGRLRLLIDLGTNAEVVLGSARRRMACSTAAGPAFEGAHITHGMWAAPGAIDYFAIHDDGKIVAHVIEGEQARGICGSGLIDAVAALLRVGVIDERGWLRSAAQCERPLPETVAQRLIEIENRMNAFVLVEREHAHDRRPILLTAGDVRQLQLVKGSIAAGTEILCREMGVRAEEIEEVLIAGAFGNYVRKSSALAIGVVPPVEPERVMFVGNAAGIGARMVLADLGARRRALEVAEKTEYVELAGREDYQSAFASSMLFRRE
jgi:uncharacterized 2Fe-2S/4Fe-4S cluster protein (DUF4445 family)